MKKTCLMSLLLVLALPTFAKNAKVADIEIQTTQGNFLVDLFEEEAPKSVENFMKYVEDGSYKGSVFHRVIKGFMIQGGGFNEKLERLPTYDPIVNESNNGLSNAYGTLAYARTNDLNSATRQFFINSIDNKFLDAQGSTNSGYAVFGKILSGKSFETLMKIDSVETGAKKPFAQDVPLETIVITDIIVLDKKEKKSAPKEIKAIKAVEPVTKALDSSK